MDNLRDLKQSFRTVHLIKEDEMIIEIKLKKDFDDWESLNFVRDGSNNLLEHLPHFQSMIKISELYDEDAGSV